MCGLRRDFEIGAIPHNSKCRYGERGAADAKPKAQIILDAAKVSAASGENSEPKQGQRSQGFRGFLMGEQFMKQADPGVALAEFISKL